MQTTLSVSANPGLKTFENPGDGKDLTIEIDVFHDDCECSEKAEEAKAEAAAKDMV